jgi:hypothetical protein
MKITIECGSCGRTVETDVVNIIKTLIECAERKSVYGGFLCEDCVKALEEEN